MLRSVRPQKINDGGVDLKGFVENIESMAVKNQESRRVLYPAISAGFAVVAPPGRISGGRNVPTVPLLRGGSGHILTSCTHSREECMRIPTMIAAGLLTASLAHAQTPAPAVKWGPAPPFFPAGARFAVLQGDPGQSGVYTVRLDMPPGYVIAPHTHPTDEHVTVMSGVLLLGMGDAVDTKGATTLRAGGFITAAASVHHYAVARGRTVVQVHGIGPFIINYINAADDPRNAKKPLP